MGGLFSRLAVSEYVYVRGREVEIPCCPLTIKHFISQIRPGGSWGGDPYSPEVDLSHCWLPIVILEGRPHQGFRGWGGGGSPIPM